MNFKRRLKALQTKMEEENVDLVIYGSCQNFQYITGITTNWRRWIDLNNPIDNVFIPIEGEPILTLTEQDEEEKQKTWIKEIKWISKEMRYEEKLREILSEIELKNNRIGIGDHIWGSTITKVLRLKNNVEIVSAESFMDNIRMIKDEEEIKRLRRVAELTDKVMEKIILKIQEGITQRELEAEIELQGKILGATDTSFPPTAGYVKKDSKPSPNPFTYPKDKGLTP